MEKMALIRGASEDGSTLGFTPRRWGGARGVCWRGERVRRGSGGGPLRADNYVHPPGKRERGGQRSPTATDPAVLFGAQDVGVVRSGGLLSGLQDEHVGMVRPA